MSKPQQPGQGNNQSGDLKIPTFGANAAAKAAAAVVQPGEDANELARAGAMSAGAAAQHDATEQEVSFDNPVGLPPEGNSKMPQGGALEAMEAPVSPHKLLEMFQQTQQMFAAIMAQQQQQAKNNPVMGRNDVEHFGEARRTTVDIPGLDKDLDAHLKRTDQRAEPVDIDLVRDMDHARMMAFLEEPVVINIHDDPTPGAENPVVLYVNGRSCLIPRGQDTIVKRKYVEMLLRAKPEAVKTRQTRDGEGNIKNHIDKMATLKYPFALVRDNNPRGIPWARKIRMEG
jgi:hypothetical protein